MGEKRPAEVFHPGEYLADELKERGWSQTEFAEIIDRPVRLVNEIVNGKRGITPDTAREFAAALGTSPELWMNLDSAYQLWKTTADLSHIEERAKMRSLYPVREMINRRWIRSSEDNQIVQSQLLRYFEIKSLTERPQLATRAAAKRSDASDADMNPLQIAWLYRVKQISETFTATPYSEEKLRDAVSELSTYRKNPSEISRIPRLLAACGVHFVIVEGLPTSKIDGVAFWNNDSPVIGMSLRYDRIDNFWFVLRHEIEHILRGDGKEVIVIDADLDTGTSDSEGLSEAERAANMAAAEFCVHQKDLDDFIARQFSMFPKEKVLGFAERMRVHPGLVVGQLQRKTQRYDLFRPLLVSVKTDILSTAFADGFGQCFPVEI